MLRRTIWSVSPLADAEVMALSSVRASVWPREAAPHTGQKPQESSSDAMDGPKVGVSFSAGEGHVAKNKGVAEMRGFRGDFLYALRNRRPERLRIS